ncbi:MAG TPA: hypothetical protein ENH82_11945 [bacterium]|nr:hypothetical protein [bacterium]
MVKRVRQKNENQIELFSVPNAVNKPHQHIEEQVLRKKDEKDTKDVSRLRKRAIQYRKDQCGMGDIIGHCRYRNESCADDEYLQEYIDRYVKLRCTCDGFNHECSPERMP